MKLKRVNCLLLIYAALFCLILCGCLLYALWDMYGDTKDCHSLPGEGCIKEECLYENYGSEKHMGELLDCLVLECLRGEKH